MDDQNDMKQKRYKLIQYQIYYMTLTIDPTDDLDPGISRSNFVIAVFQEWVV